MVRRDESSVRMTMKGHDRLICGLDAGTWKTCLLMSKTRRDGSLEVVAGGFSKSSGLAKGIVVNLEETAASIRQAADEVESRSGRSVDSVVAGISGNHIKSYTFRGAVPVQGKHGEVTAADVENAISAAQSVPLSPDQHVIHLLPQEFFLDNRDGIRNPLGLAGAQLDVNLHVIACAGTLSQCLINAANKAKIEVSRLMLQSIASGEAVLTPEEKDLGTAVIDIGGGTTDVAVFAKNSVGYAAVIPVGGEHFTRDLVAGLRISREEAERIKNEFGNVLPETIAPDEMTAVQGLGTRGTWDFSRSKICEYLHDRGAELLEIVKNEIDRAGMNLIGGAVLTGGGSLLPGMAELSERILEMPVRLGYPRGIDGLTGVLAHPASACAVGLVLLQAQRNILLDYQSKPRPGRSWTSRILGIFDK